MGYVYKRRTKEPLGKGYTVDRNHRKHWLQSWKIMKQTNCLPRATGSATAQTKIAIWTSCEIAYTGLIHVIESFPGYAVVSCVRDGAAALEQSLELSPDILIILEEILERSGFEHIKRIKEAIPQIGIIMITSLHAQETVVAALEAGVNGYCLLTIPREELETALKAVSQGATWLDQSVAHWVTHIQRPAIVGPTLPVLPKESLLSAAHDVLSQREREVLELLVNGLSNREIAARLVVSVDTVKSHNRNIMHKLGSIHRHDTILRAINQGLVQVAAMTED